QCASWLKVSEVRIRCELDDMGLKTANKPPVPKGTKRGSYGVYGMPRPLMSEKRIAAIYDDRSY
ncbi:MAG TPA: hypothetical protein VKA94_06410, partial [Hyphomicrobiales bacterium]|nr:hypothetical protein [Hyphomicrobiales bacterium]